MQEGGEHLIIPAKLDWHHRCLTRRFPDHDEEFSVKRLLEQRIAARNGPRQTGGWMHPSNLVSCLRATYYDYTNAPGWRAEQPRDVKLADVGSMLHEQVQRELLDELGAKEFLSERKMRFPALKFSFRCDGVLVERDWLIEIKTVGESALKAMYSPRAKDIVQVHPYMYALDIPRAILYYKSRESGDDREFKIYFDQEVWDGVLQKIYSIQEHVRKGTKPPKAKSEYTCKRCDYFKHCYQGD